MAQAPPKLRRIGLKYIVLSYLVLKDPPKELGKSKPLSLVTTPSWLMVSVCKLLRLVWNDVDCWTFFSTNKYFTLGS